MFCFRLSMFLTPILPYRCRCVNIDIKFRCRYFLDVFRVLFTPSVFWRAAELGWSIPLEILIFHWKPSERTNQVLPLTSKQKVKLQFFFMDHVFHDFTISHYIQEILCLEVVFGIQFMRTVTITGKLIYVFMIHLRTLRRSHVRETFFLGYMKFTVSLY